jgi:Cys-tRNA(Pro)/Cys-tRNA(Cys) deacylase
MTPAVRRLEALHIPFKLHRYDHDPQAESFGEEAAAKLGVSTERIFKTLIAQVDDDALVMAILPVAGKLDLKKLAAALDGKKADLADPKLAEKATGYVVGGISPLGGRKTLPTLIDETADLFDTLYISAGQRGLQIEIAPGALTTLIGARLLSLTKE